MTLEQSNAAKFGEDRGQLPSAQRSEPKTEERGVSIGYVRTRVSGLSDEEKDKLLFEVFDMLLRKSTQGGELSTGRNVPGCKNVG